MAFAVSIPPISVPHVIVPVGDSASPKGHWAVFSAIFFPIPPVLDSIICSLIIYGSSEMVFTTLIELGFEGFSPCKYLYECYMNKRNQVNKAVF